jgi:hypothetical protein
MDPATKALPCKSVSDRQSVSNEESHSVCDDCYLHLKDSAKDVYLGGELFVIDADLPIICPLCRGTEPLTTEMFNQLKRCCVLEMNKNNKLHEELDEMREKLKKTYVPGTFAKHIILESALIYTLIAILFLLFPKPMRCHMC